MGFVLIYIVVDVLDALDLQSRGRITELRHVHHHPHRRRTELRNRSSLPGKCPLRINPNRFPVLPTRANEHRTRSKERGICSSPNELIRTENHKPEKSLYLLKL